MTSTNHSLRPIRSILTLMVLICISVPCCKAFTTSPSRISPSVASRCSSSSLAFVSAKSSSRLRSVDEDVTEVTEVTTEEASAAKASLKEKMKSWEATEDEIKAATLGGVVPKLQKRSDGFDVGLWIMFPFIVATSLLFFVFPFIKDSIDVSSVGPPPMM